jgi:hypothetical protein
MRNRIAHGYYGLDFAVVWETIRASIPEFLARLPKTASWTKRKRRAASPDAASPAPAVAPNVDEISSPGGLAGLLLPRAVC